MPPAERPIASGAGVIVSVAMAEPFLRLALVTDGGVVFKAGSDGLGIRLAFVLQDVA